MTKAAGVLPNGRRWMNEHGPADGPNGVQVREIIGRSGCLHRMRNFVLGRRDAVCRKNYGGLGTMRGEVIVGTATRAATTTDGLH